MNSFLSTFCIPRSSRLRPAPAAAGPLQVLRPFHIAEHCCHGRMRGSTVPDGGSPAFGGLSGTRRGKRARQSNADEAGGCGVSLARDVVFKLPRGKLSKWLNSPPCCLCDVRPSSASYSNNALPVQCTTIPGFFAPSSASAACKPRLRCILQRALAEVRQEMGSVDNIPSDSLLVIATPSEEQTLGLCESAGFGNARALLGLCVARELSMAYRLHCEPSLEPDKRETCGSGAPRLEEERCHGWEKCAMRIGDTRCVGSAFCGVQLVWVAEQYRRSGVANALVDVARRHVSYGFDVPACQVAFSEPTTLGALFARRYSGRPDFLIF
uniref:Uncharacterized protein TCIL3000_1_1000 n=1 Tax=Trypanosoma congolense (strain IL3000) TaxID=1068625 RepID=G0UIY2_TRYCI|nr:unnamed protein product [Trypanosoma congolense IL3000]